MEEKALSLLVLYPTEKREGEGGQQEAQSGHGRMEI